MSNGKTARIEANPRGGRDFVVGDVHGVFVALETLLAHVEFDPKRDRLFALGDLVASLAPEPPASSQGSYAGSRTIR